LFPNTRKFSRLRDDLGQHGIAGLKISVHDVHGKAEGVPNRSQKVPRLEVYSDDATLGFVLSGGYDERRPIVEGHLTRGRVELNGRPYSVSKFFVVAEDVVMEWAPRTKDIGCIGLFQSEVAISILEAENQRSCFTYGDQLYGGQNRFRGEGNGQFTASED
jgi:hypothetical protein